MPMELRIIGGGLAGCEAAWQAAERGIPVTLYEMRPKMMTEVHKTALLGELVCSNSLGSTGLATGNGLLFHEMKFFNSLICQIAEEVSVPAGSALAVDRLGFAQKLTDTLLKHPRIRVVHEEVIEIPSEPCIIATGPLTSPAFLKALQNFHGVKNLFFYDAIAPLIDADSIDMQIVFRASRYGENEIVSGDYLNCPMDKETYENFVRQLVHARQIELKLFEREIRQGVDAGYGPFFEGCLPIEILARRGMDTLMYGPLRPVGLRRAMRGSPPYAVVQLRQDDIAKTTYNMVGFQTNLTFSEQRRLFRLIPGLQNAEFVRFGQMHRNTYLFAPSLIDQNLQAKSRQDIFFAGQLIGVEGYLGNAATGLVAGINATKMLKQEPLLTFPPEMMIGALCFYVSHASQGTFQPMKANFGLLPPLTSQMSSKKDKKMAYSGRALDLAEKISTKVL